MHSTPEKVPDITKVCSAVGVAINFEHPWWSGATTCTAYPPQQLGQESHDYTTAVHIINFLQMLSFFRVLPKMADHVWNSAVEAAVDEALHDWPCMVGQGEAHVLHMQLGFSSRSDDELLLSEPGRLLEGAAVRHEMVCWVS